MAKISPGLTLALGLGGAMLLTALGMQLFTRGGDPVEVARAPEVAPVEAAPLESTSASPSGADGLRPRVSIAVVEAAPPMRIQPGPRMDVLKRVENGFRGLVRRSRETLALNSAAPPPPVEGSAEYGGATIDDLRYADTRLESIEAEAPPRSARVRSYSAEVTVDGDCRAYSSRADRLVCREPALAAADDRMRAALDRAMDGPDREAVLADQGRWLAARERAAQDGPGAVDHMYAIRLRELEGG